MAYTRRREPSIDVNRHQAKYADAFSLRKDVVEFSLTAVLVKSMPAFTI